MTHDNAQTMTPEQAVSLLTAGNLRFATGASQHHHADEARRAQVVAEGQHPFATMITCSDSRVPLEILFDQGIGDIFVIRVAGNVCATDEIGSIEYGAGHLGTPLCVVLGHSHCGAVTAVLTGAEVHGCIRRLVAPIIPAVVKVMTNHTGKDHTELLDLAVRENIWQAITDLLMGSDDVRRLVSLDRLQIVGAMYDLATGLVEWLGPHPEQQEILAAARN